MRWVGFIFFRPTFADGCLYVFWIFLHYKGPLLINYKKITDDWLLAYTIFTLVPLGPLKYIFKNFMEEQIGTFNPPFCNYAHA